VHRTRVALSGLLVFFCLPGSVFSQTGSHPRSSLSGVVFSEGGNHRIANASVRLGNEAQAFWQEFVTSDSGEFAFQGVPPGHFILQIHATGFDPLVIPMDLSLGSGHGLSFFLKPTGTSNDNFVAASSVSVHELSMPAAARELVASGKRKFYVEKSPQSGLKDFQAAVTKAPQYYEAYHQIGLAFLAMQNLAEAEKNLRMSVELSRSDYPDADIALGSLLVDHGDPANAEPLLRRGLELFPRSWVALYELARIELARGHLETARQSAQQAESLAPNKPLPHRLLVIINFQEKDYRALLLELDAFIALEPDSPAGVRAKEIRAQTQETLEAAAKQPQ
jgi:tetratricopeptide (TPR) repeat protein